MPFVKVKSISKRPYEGKVLNLETELTHTYSAEGLAVHNCTNKDDIWKEFHYISSEAPGWTESSEKTLRLRYSEGGFNREFLALFGDEMAGVFRHIDISQCLYDYDLSKEKPTRGWKYVMGVDWNKLTGTHIVVLGFPLVRNLGDFKFRLVEKKIIRKSESTQLEGIKAVQQLDSKWNCDFVYADMGFGIVQKEMILNQKSVGEYDEDGYLIRSFKGRYIAVDMGSNWEIIDPETRQKIKKPTKGLMVTLAQLQVENHRCVLPSSEDTESPIVPEELAYTDIGIVQQMRNFRETKTSPTGRITYSQDYEHTLTAWMLSIFGILMEFSDYRKAAITRYAYAVGKFGSGSVEVPTHDEFGERLSPSRVAMARQAALAAKLKEQEEDSAKRGNRRQLDRSNDRPVKESSDGIHIATDGVPVKQYARRTILPRKRVDTPSRRNRFRKTRRGRSH